MDLKLLGLIEMSFFRITIIFAIFQVGATIHVSRNSKETSGWFAITRFGILSGPADLLLFKFLVKSVN